MKFKPIDPPRCFTVGSASPVTIKDCARIELEPDEQVTFVTPSGAEYDVARKDWGFYATPSLNQRLPGFGLRALLAKNRDGRFCLMLVERGREPAMEAYFAEQGMSVACWLDSDQALAELERRLGGARDAG